MKKRFMAMLSLVMLVAVLFTACSGDDGSTTTNDTNSTSGGQTTNDTSTTPEVEAPTGLTGDIEFMTGTGIDTALFAVYEAITDQFLAANPDVSIELIPSSADHEGEVKTRLGSGNVPDIWMTHGWSYGRYRDFLLDVSGEPWAADFNQALAPAMKSGGDALYAFPIDLDVAGIIYNKDVLAATGLEVADITTWDKFKEACDAMLEAGKTPIMNAGKDGWPEGLYIDWIAPGFYTDAELQSQLDGTFVPDKYEEAFKLVQDFKQAGYFNPDYSTATGDDASLALAQGDAGFAFMMNFVAVASFEYNPDASIGFMPIPDGMGGDPYFVTGEKNALGIWKDSESLDACKAYVDFLAQPGNLTKLAEATGNNPGLTTVTVDLGGLSDSFATVANTRGVPYFDRVFMPNGSWDSIVTTCNGIITETMSIEEAIEKISSDYDTLYAQAQE